MTFAERPVLRHTASMERPRDFFVAPDDATAARVKGEGPRRVFPSLPCGEVHDPEDAVIEWENLFDEITGRALRRAGEPRVLTEITNDGSYVFALSDRLLTRLATADHTRLDHVARTWARQCRENGDPATDEEATAYLGQLAGLARMAVGRGHRLYCSLT